VRLVGYLKIKKISRPIRMKLLAVEIRSGLAWIFVRSFLSVGFQSYMHSYAPKLALHFSTFTKVMNESKSFILLHGPPLLNTACLWHANFNWLFAQALISWQTDTGIMPQIKFGVISAGKFHAVFGVTTPRILLGMYKKWGEDSVSICYEIEIYNMFIFFYYLLLIFYYFALWPTNTHLFHKLSHSYMFRHYRVILRELVINTLPSYTSIIKFSFR
jgi:hypothetical protein